MAASDRRDLAPPLAGPAVRYHTTTAIRFPRILLVSMHRSFGLHLREALSFHRFTAVVEQEPTAQATITRLSSLERWKIRLVLVALPLLQGGLDLISDIRYRSLAPAVPLLSIDRAAGALEISHALRLGADDCLSFPEDWKAYGDLANRMQQLLVLHERDQPEVRNALDQTPIRS